MEIEFEEEDILLLYTDGLTEAENPSGEFFGEQRLMDLFRQHASLEPKALLNTLFDEIYDFVGSQNILDDISLMIVKNTRQWDIYLTNQEH